jgi:hypothetical protein
VTLEGKVRSMRLLHPVSEDEVVAVFLRGELDSSRYGEKLSAILARDGRDLRVLRSPDLGDAETNAYRRQLLDEYRAYERRDGLFLGFPQAVEWFRAALERDEVLDILFINWKWWLELSGGTRRPRDAASRIRAGEVAGVTADEDEPLAQASATQPELIAATTPAHSPLVLVEGHFRLTAYALFPEYVPEELEILLGVSDEMGDWCQF